MEPCAPVDLTRLAARRQVCRITGVLLITIEPSEYSVLVLCLHLMKLACYYSESQIASFPLTRALCACRSFLFHRTPAIMKHIARLQKEAPHLNPVNVAPAKHVRFQASLKISELLLRSKPSLLCLTWQLSTVLATAVSA